jgi:hypothetical protein
MSLKEKINLVKQQLEINEIDTMALEKSIGKKLVDYDSIDALVAALMGYYNPLIEGISETFKNFCPFPVNSLYLSLGNENPSTLWLGTTWAKQEGRFLLGSSSSYGLGTTGGASTVKLIGDNLPATKIQLDSFSLSRGTMEINGDLGVIDTSSDFSGAFYTEGTKYGNGSASFANKPFYKFRASRSWTGTTNTAQPQTVNLGKGTPFSILPPYLVVNIWKRLS